MSPLRHATRTLWLCVIVLGVGTVSACNVSKCVGDSFQLAPRSSPAMEPYYVCMDNASGTLAFQCRCTLRIRDCLRRPDGGNCSDPASSQLSLETCGRFVVVQSLGCSITLCDSSAGKAAVAVALLVTIMSTIAPWLL